MVSRLFVAGLQTALHPEASLCCTSTDSLIQAFQLSSRGIEMANDL